MSPQKIRKKKRSIQKISSLMLQNKDKENGTFLFSPLFPRLASQIILRDRNFVMGEEKKKTMAVWSSIEVDQALVTVSKFALGKGKNNSHMNLEDRQNGREREREGVIIPREGWAGRQPRRNLENN